MSAIYSTPLFTNYVPAGTTELFSSSAELVAVVRDIEVFNGAGVAQDVLFTINVSGGDLIFYKAEQLQRTTWAQWTGRLVLPKAVAVRVITQTDFVHICVSGYELG